MIEHPGGPRCRPSLAVAIKEATACLRQTQCTVCRCWQAEKVATRSAESRAYRGTFVMSVCAWCAEDDLCEPQYADDHEGLILVPARDEALERIDAQLAKIEKQISQPRRRRTPR